MADRSRITPLHKRPAHRRLARAGALMLMLLTACWPLRGCDRADDGAITIEFWTLALRPFATYMQSCFSTFESAHPGVKVKWVDVPFEAMDRKLISAAAAGLAPDLVNFSDKTYARYVSLGALQDLRPLLPPRVEESFVPGAAGLGRINGKLLALPWYLTTQTVLANTELLAAAGMTPDSLPRNWTDARAAARRFRRTIGRDGVYLFSVPLGQESDLPMMLMAEGVPPLVAGPDGRVVANLTRPEVVAIVSDWVALFREGCLPRECVTNGSAHLPELYQNSRLAIINSGPNFLSRVLDVAPGVFAATHVGPPITAALGRGHIAVMVLGVTATSKHPRLAAELAAFMTSAQSQEAFCAIVSILPSTSASLAKPQFNDHAAAAQLAASAELAAAARQNRAPRPIPDKLVEAGMVAAQALNRAVAFTPALAAWPDMRRVFEERIKRVLLDGDDAASALAIIEREWNRILDSQVAAPIDAVPRPAPATDQQPSSRAAVDAPTETGRCPS